MAEAARMVENNVLDDSESDAMPSPLRGTLEFDCSDWLHMLLQEQDNGWARIPSYSHLRTERRPRPPAVDRCPMDTASDHLCSSTWFGPHQRHRNGTLGADEPLSCRRLRVREGVSCR